MKIEIRSDGLHISGYVNVTGKLSKPLYTPSGKRVVETIEERTFSKAISKGGNITMQLDHRPDRILADTAGGNLQLREDSIGLHADALVTDPETIQGARDGKLKGWSFGMKNVVDSIEDRANDLPLRKVKEIDLDHVALIMNKSPAYAATSVEVRAEDDEQTLEMRSSDEEIEITKEEPKKEPIDYSSYENRLHELTLNNL